MEANLDPGSSIGSFALKMTSTPEKKTKLALDKGRFHT
jgi:hypothetical protein